MNWPKFSVHGMSRAARPHEDTMARTRYVPETEKLEPRYGKGDADFKESGFSPETPECSAPWEFQSVPNFVEDKLDSDQTTFTGGDLQKLAQTTGVSYPLVRVELEKLGLTLAAVARERTFATFGTNQHDRFCTAEAKMMSGGGGGNSILGMC